MKKFFKTLITRMAADSLVLLKHYIKYPSRAPIINTLICKMGRHDFEVIDANDECVIAQEESNVSKTECTNCGKDVGTFGHCECGAYTAPSSV